MNGTANCPFPCLSHTTTAHPLRSKWPELRASQVMSPRVSVSTIVRRSAPDACGTASMRPCRRCRGNRPVQRGIRSRLRRIRRLRSTTCPQFPNEMARSGGVQVLRKGWCPAVPVSTVCRRLKQNRNPRKRHAGCKFCAASTSAPPPPADRHEAKRRRHVQRAARMIGSERRSLTEVPSGAAERLRVAETST